LKFIIKPKGGGKTTKLIEMSIETKSVIVVKNKYRERYIQALALSKNLKIRTLTFEKFLMRQYCNKDIKGFLIDNVDELLQGITRYPVIAVTATQENNT